MTSQGRLRHRSCEGQHGQAAVLELGQAHLLLTLLESPTVGQERMVLYILSVNVIKSQESNLSTKKYQFRWLNPPGSILAFIHCRPVFSETLPVSWPYTFSALPFPILVTGEQTGKAIVASHLNGVPLEDLLGAAELQDADPEEDLSGRPNESDPTHVDSFFADLLWDIVGLCGFKVLVFVDVLQGRILQLFAMFGTGK